MSGEDAHDQYGNVRTPRDSDDFPPEEDVASRGSSVSAGFVDEYNQLLQYAVVLPTLTNANAANAAAKAAAAANTPQARPPTKMSPPPTHRSNPIGGNPRSTRSSTTKLPAERSLPTSNQSSGGALPIQKSPPGTSQDGEQATSSGVHSEPIYNSDTSDSISFYASKAREAIERTPQGSSPPGGGAPVGLDVFDEMAQQMKKALRQELLQQILMEQEKSQQKLERQRQAFSQEMQQLLGTLGDAQQEIKRLRVECESKDNAVDALTVNLEKQRKELLATRAFYRWKDILKDRKLENYENRLADRQYQVNVLKRTMQAWKSGTTNQWRERVKLNCQSHAEHVCHVLAEKYELKLETLKSELTVRERENERLRQQREEFQNQMKEAFMRGVCALNLEAMKVLSPGSSKANSQTAISHDSLDNRPKPSQRALFQSSATVPDEFILEDATDIRTNLSPVADSASENSESLSFPEPSAGAKGAKHNVTPIVEANFSPRQGPLRPKPIYPLGSQFRSMARDADSLGEHSTDDVSSDMSMFSHKDLMYSYNERCRQNRTSNADQQANVTRSPPRIISAAHAPPLTFYTAMQASPTERRLNSLLGSAGAPANPRAAALPLSKPLKSSKEAKAVQSQHTSLYKASKSLVTSHNSTAPSAITRNTYGQAPGTTSNNNSNNNNFHVHRHYHPDAAAALLLDRQTGHTSNNVNLRSNGLYSGRKPASAAPQGKSYKKSTSLSSQTSNVSPVGSSGGGSGSQAAFSGSSSSNFRQSGDGRGSSTGLCTSQVVEKKREVKAAAARREPVRGDRSDYQRNDLIEYRS